jgi:YidC/Oxa1 family membrane protein insertase
MDTRRILLFAALAFIVYSLWTDWQKDYPFTVAAVQTEAKNKALTIEIATCESYNLLSS